MSKKTSKNDSDRVRGAEDRLEPEKGRLEVQFIRVDDIDWTAAAEGIPAEELLKELDQIHAQTPVRRRK